MDTVLKRLILIASAGLLGLGALSGCASGVRSIDSAAALDKASSGAADTVVFGKFRLVTNGEAVRLGDGIFANAARLHVYGTDGQRELVGQVGQQGEFAWVLAPGRYVLTGIEFTYHGEKLRPETSFTFTVSDGHEATYVGTITLETVFDSGYYGVTGAVERYTVSNDCERACEQMLERIGLQPADATVALFQWDNQMAGTQEPLAP